MDKAGGCPKIEDFTSLFDYGICILGDYVIPFLITLGMVIFLVGIISYVKAGDDEEKRSQGRGLMLFGIIALFIMISAWGFVNILSNSFFGGNAENQALPKKATSVFQK